MLLNGAQVDGVQLNAAWGGLLPLAGPRRRGLLIHTLFRLFLCLPLSLLLLLLVPGQASCDGFLDAATAAVQAAAPRPHTAALGAAGLAAVGSPRGETFIRIVDVEGILPTAHAVSI